MLITDMSNTQKLHSIFEIQKDLLLQDLSLSQQSLDANDTLVSERVISRLDNRNEKSKLLSKP